MAFFYCLTAKAQRLFNCMHIETVLANSLVLLGHAGWSMFGDSLTFLFVCSYNMNSKGKLL